jgi:hypothetical protein
VEDGEGENEEEWGGFDDEAAPVEDKVTNESVPQKAKKPKVQQASKHSHNAVMQRKDLGAQKKKKRKK